MRSARRMKTPLVCILVVAAQFSLATFTASAHPGSGIVVDQQGNVYFTHLGRGIGKIDPQGKLTYVGETRGGHWLCLDAEGSFSHTPPRHFERITPGEVSKAAAAIAVVTYAVAEMPERLPR